MIKLMSGPEDDYEDFYAAIGGAAGAVGGLAVACLGGYELGTLINDNLNIAWGNSQFNLLRDSTLARASVDAVIISALAVPSTFACAAIGYVTGVEKPY